MLITIIYECGILYEIIISCQEKVYTIKSFDKNLISKYYIVRQKRHEIESISEILSTTNNINLELINPYLESSDAEKIKDLLKSLNSTNVEKQNLHNLIKCLNTYESLNRLVLEIIIENQQEWFKNNS